MGMAFYTEGKDRSLPRGAYTIETDTKGDHREGNEAGEESVAAFVTAGRVASGES